MSELRNLTDKEIKLITSGVENQKLDVIRILKSRVKVYKLTQTELKKIKQFMEKLTNNNKIPRYLNDEELDYIVSVIPAPLSCTKEVMDFNHQKIVQKIRFDLSTFKITPEKKALDMLRERVLESFMRSLAQPGFSAGNNGALAIGSKLTQISLDAFHNSGAANSNEAGLQRIKDLFNPNTKRPNSTCTIHFKDKYLTKEEIFKSYTQKLKGVTVKSLIDYSEPLTEIPDKDLEWYQNYETIYSETVPKSRKFLRLHINTYKCYIYDIQIKEICNIIEQTTRVELNKKSVYCVCSPSFKGIIDIHADEEFIRKSVSDFSATGKTFRGCERRYYARGKKTTDETNTNPVSKTYIKTNIIESESIEDLSSIFLTVILEGCFKDMNLVGIKGIDNIRTETIKLTNKMNFVKVYDEKTLQRILKENKTINPDQFYRLYYCYIDYMTIHLTGIPAEKFVKFMELSGMKILEQTIIGVDNPRCIILMPEVPDTKYEKDGKMVPRFVKKGSVVIDLMTDKEIVTSEQPQQLLSRKFDEGEKEIKNNVDYMIRNEESELYYPEIYRNGYYSYAKAYGRDMINSILRDKLVDPQFTSSDTPMDVYEYYGIESARLFFIKEYTANENIAKMNPVNIELLVDFQTVLGQLSSVTATDIAKHGKNALSAASFEQPIEAFRKAGGIGAKDLVNNIPSCLITGKRTINGTGIVDVEFDQEYLEDTSNQAVVEVRNQIDREDVDNREILGGCVTGGRISENYTGDTGDELSDDEEFMQTREPVPMLSKRKPSKRVSGLLRKGKPKVNEDIFEEDESVPDIDLKGALEEEDDDLFDL
tara:strand:+ start:574 stop:3036 length:2463 start_codon:yes stop_codon:yes gene_type:complete